MPLPTISFEGHMLDFVDGCKHLGHTFCATLSNVVSIDVETKRFFSSFNSFFHVFKGASPIVLCCLLLSYSTIFYGCQLWSCNDIELHRLRVAYSLYIDGKAAYFDVTVRNSLQPCHIVTAGVATQAGEMEKDFES